MTDRVGPKINFSISPGAVRAIEALRAKCEEADSKTSAVCIGWGYWTLDDGTACDRLFIGFYNDSQREEICAYTHQVAGLDVVFFVLDNDRARFEGKTIDYVDDDFRLVP